MTLSIRELDQMVENCEADIRRLTNELNERMDEVERMRTLLKEAINNRRVWVEHPDRKHHGQNGASMRISCREDIQ